MNSSIQRKICPSIKQIESLLAVQRKESDEVCRLSKEMCNEDPSRRHENCEKIDLFLCSPARGESWKEIEEKSKKIKIEANCSPIRKLVAM